MMRGLLVCLAVLANPAAADALTRLDPAGSQVEFTYTQMGVSLQGRFRGLTGQASFDPARPQAARARIEVPVAGIDTGLAEADAEAAGKDWFDAATHPVARFEADAVKSLGGNRYQVDGRLTLKGRTRKVSAPFTFTADARGGLFTGQFVLRRGDFAIGEGAWRDYSLVGNEVGVRFKLRLDR